MKKLLAGLAAAALVSAGSAGATVINFSKEANNNGERGISDGTVLNTTELGGLNLRFSGGRGGENFEFAYFNAFQPAVPGFKGRMAGLGTCTTLDRMMQCMPAGDDTVDHGEFVRIDFVDAPFEIVRLSFNGRFASLNDSPLLLQITTSLAGVVSQLVLSFADATTHNFGFADWIQFDFLRDQGTEAKFFVSTISNEIPVPGALPLLLSGLAGLGFAARRRRTA